MLCKASIPPHLEYRSPLLLGINKNLIIKLESAYYCPVKALINLGNSLENDFILIIADMHSLKYRS